LRTLAILENIGIKKGDVTKTEHLSLKERVGRKMPDFLES